jgi:hypothetical protein
MAHVLHRPLDIISLFGWGRIGNYHSRITGQGIILADLDTVLPGKLVGDLCGQICERSLASRRDFIFGEIPAINFSAHIFILQNLTGLYQEGRDEYQPT